MAGRDGRAAEARPLGLFGASELRAGGMGGRGFLQPLMAPRPGTAVRPEAEVIAGLARRGQVLNSASGWKAVGRLAEVLGAAAAARSLVACPPSDTTLAAPPGSDVMGADRISMGRLGSTDLVLDLLPTPDGYQVRLVHADDMAAELAEWCGLGRVDPAADDIHPLSEGGHEWIAAESAGLLSRQVAPTIETATVTGPDRPLLQQRISQFLVGDGSGGDATRAGRWLGLGVAEGSRTGRSMAPAGPARVRRVLRQALLGQRIEL